MWNPASSSVTNARRRRLDASGSHGPAAPGRSAQPPPIGAGERPPRGSPRPQAATAGRPAPAPTGQGHPVGGRAASTSSQVDEPEQRQELDGDHPTSRRLVAWPRTRSDVTVLRPSKALAIWASTMAANTIVDKVASAGPPAGRAPPDAGRATAPGRPAPWPARRPRPPGRGTRRREPGRPRPANEPTGSAVAAPAPLARVARRQGPAPAAGRYRCPGRGSAAPTGPGGSVRRQRPWEPHLEDGDPRTWAVSLWPTRIRQRMGVGWEARVLM